MFCNSSSTDVFIALIPNMLWTKKSYIKYLEFGSRKRANLKQNENVYVHQKQWKNRLRQWKWESSYCLSDKMCPSTSLIRNRCSTTSDVCTKHFKTCPENDLINSSVKDAQSKFHTAILSTYAISFKFLTDFFHSILHLI